MSEDYEVEITFANDGEATFGVSNGAISPTQVPDAYTTAEYAFVNNLLRTFMLTVREVGVKSITIIKQ